MMLTVPALCWLCGMPLALSHWGFCSRCVAALPAPPPACPVCGLPAVVTTMPCGRCLHKPPAWERLLYVTDYCQPLSALVQALKFHRQTALAKPLARLMLLRAREALREQAFPRPDLIIGVPLHRRRAWHRGFNQSALLAKPLARWLGCRYDDRVLRRIRSTPVQHHLSARLRKKNLRAAFRLELPVRDLHIVIVDDVVTTGSTVGEMAKLLHRHGAATVQVWCLCRTL